MDNSEAWQAGIGLHFGTMHPSKGGV